MLDALFRRPRRILETSRLGIGRRQRVQGRRMTRAREAARPFREKTFALGEPKVDLDRALSLAASLEDEEVCEELARRK